MENSKMSIANMGKLEYLNQTAVENIENLNHSTNLKTENMNQVKNGESLTPPPVSINQLDAEEILFLYYKTKSVVLSLDKYFVQSRESFDRAISEYRKRARGNQHILDEIDEAVKKADEIKSVNDINEYRICKNICKKLKDPAAIIEDVYPDLANRIMEDIKKGMK